MPQVERAAFRVVHTEYFNYYDPWLQDFRDELEDVKRFHIDEWKWQDQSPYFRVIAGNNRGFTAIVPLWLVHPFAENLLRVQQVGNALTHVERDRSPLADEVKALMPYVELRADQDSIDPRTGEYKEGEAIYAEIFANTLKASGYTEAVILEPHSREAMDYFEIPYLALTAAPIFACWLKEKDLVASDTSIVALDKGTLQRCWYLTEMLRLDPKSNLIIYDKERGENNEVCEENLLYGDPRGKDIIIFDDLVDTSGSIGANCQALRGAGCGQITVIATHGVLSYKARERIEELLKEGIIDHFVLTDSRPEAAYKLEGIEGVAVLQTAPLFAKFAKALIDKSISEIQEDPIFAPYILEPIHKEEVWERFSEEVGIGSANRDQCNVIPAKACESRNLSLLPQGQV